MFSSIPKDYDHDTQDPPPIEMSQDCPIEWDESGNEDLRQLAKSPRFATPGSASTVSSSSSLAGRGVLDDIKRRLERPMEDRSPASLQTQPVSATKKKQKGNNHHIEDEIDDIFSVLKQDEVADEGRISPASGTTQQTSNVSSMPPPKPIATSSLASRLQRRRRVTAESESSLQTKRRRRLPEIHVDPPAASMPIGEVADSESDFEVLLQQMTTAESSSIKLATARAPLGPVDKNVLNGKNVAAAQGTLARQVDEVEQCQQGQPSDRRIIPETRNEVRRSARKAPIVPVGPPTVKVVGAQPRGSNQQPKVLQQISNPPPRILTSSNDAEDEFGDFNFDDEALAQLDVLLSVKSSQQPLPRQLTQNAKLSQYTASNKHGEQKSLPVTQAKSTTPPISSPFVTSRVVPNRPKDNPAAERTTGKPVVRTVHKTATSNPKTLGATSAAIGAMRNSHVAVQNRSTNQNMLPPGIPAAQMKPTLMPQNKPCTTTRAMSVPPPQKRPNPEKFLATLGRITEQSSTGKSQMTQSGTNPPPKQSSTTSKPTNASSSIVDDFGEFPDMDFDAVDNAIATQTMTISNLQPPNALPLPKAKSAVKPQRGPINTSGVIPNPLTTKADQAKLPATLAGTTHSRSSVNSQYSEPASNSASTIPSTTTKQANAASFVEDDFGEFPDMDFDAIDKAVENRLTQMSQPPAPVRTDAKPHHDFGPLTFPANALVKNPKVLTQKQELAFATFSRYKVLEIYVDSSTYTKRLAVAVWKDSMLQDVESEKSIHRNVKVTKPSTSSQSSTKFHPTHKNTYNIDGYLHLRGEWYHTQLSVGDLIHVCSLSGQYRTDALPIILHTCPPPGSDIDDIVLVVHPDILMTPTTVSETVGCSRRAVLKARIGSTGLSQKAALVGTMRHSLFEICMKEQNFDTQYVRRKVQKIVRQNAESLLSCRLPTEEAEGEVFSVLPLIHQFISEYTDFGKSSNNSVNRPMKRVEGHSMQPDIRVIAHSAHSVEEPLVSHELALKGNVDAILETTSQQLGTKRFASSGPMKSLMSLELKTGHNQATHNAHLAQLALYILLLQISYGAKPNNIFQNSTQNQAIKNGASTGAMLLYLNQKSARVVHVSPLLGEIKSLMGQRNVAATGIVQASRPRGIALAYEDESMENEKDAKEIELYPAPPADLPQLLQSSHSCSRCYTNRECMLYAAAERNPLNLNQSAALTHKDIFDRFTGHLGTDDINFFKEWDRLIDLEADASHRSVALSWLTMSKQREQEKGETISCLEYDGPKPAGEGRAIMVFRRSKSGSVPPPTSLDNLSFSRGDQVVLGTDATSFGDADQQKQHRNERTNITRKRFRHRMHIVRGSVERLEGDTISITAGREDLERIRDLVQRHRKEYQNSNNPQLLFRVDKDKASVGVGTLRQNMINFLTADSPIGTGGEESPEAASKRIRLPRLRDIVIRLKPPRVDCHPRDSFFKNPMFQIPGCDMDRLSEEFQTLNSDQQNAVEMVLNAKDFAIIQGLPGTGKTQTLAFITRLLAARGKRVLVTSYTHSAVDNVALKLIEKGVKSAPESLSPVVRIAKKTSCHKEVHSLLVSELAGQLECNILSQDSAQVINGISICSPQTPTPSASSESLKRVISNARIVCCTALSVPRSPLLLDEKFDVVIVDEAGQISQPAILGALMSAESFVLVGDHLQLPPLVTSEIAQSGGFGVSLLSRLTEKYPTSVAPLTYQYRMNADICRLSSFAVYGGKLKCGNADVASQILELPNFPQGLPTKASPKCYGWLNAVIDPQKPAIFIDTDNISRRPRGIGQLGEDGNHAGIEALERKVGGTVGGNVVNPTEAALVRYLTVGLTASGLQPADIGVISPFRAQIENIQESATIKSLKQEGLELSTIDRYQGRDKPVIILSLVRSNLNGKAGRLLQDIRRLNVAMTRAKFKLVVVGSFSTLKNGSPPLSTMLEDMDKHQRRFLLPENAVECYSIP